MPRVLKNAPGTGPGANRWLIIRRSGCIYYLIVGEYRLFAEGISQRIFFNQINPVSENALKLINHIDKFEQSPTGIVLETNQNIHVAVGAKVV
jgi:hypothetical protein